MGSKDFGPSVHAIIKRIMRMVTKASWEVAVLRDDKHFIANMMRGQRKEWLLK